MEKYLYHNLFILNESLLETLTLEFPEFPKKFIIYDNDLLKHDLYISYSKRRKGPNKVERYLEIYFKNTMMVFSFHSTNKNNTGNVKEHNRYHAKIHKIKEDPNSIKIYQEYIFRQVNNIKYKQYLLNKLSGGKYMSPVFFEFIYKNIVSTTILPIKSTILRGIIFNQNFNMFQTIQLPDQENIDLYDTFILSIMQSIDYFNRGY